MHVMWDKVPFSSYSNLRFTVWVMISIWSVLCGVHTAHDIGQHRTMLYVIVRQGIQRCRPISYAQCEHRFRLRANIWECRECKD